MKQALKNAVGGILGYHQCPVTGDTLWRNHYVPYAYEKTKKGFKTIDISKDYIKRYLDVSENWRENETQVAIIVSAYLKTFRSIYKTPEEIMRCEIEFQHWLMLKCNKKLYARVLALKKKLKGQP